MKEIIYKSQLAPRRRSPWALVVGPGDEIEKFAGETIPGKVAVIATDCETAGTWSARIYRLQVAPGVRFISGHFGFETGTFPEGLRAATGMPADRWPEVANALGVTLPTAQRFMREWLPKLAARLDQIEADIASLDESEAGGATVIYYSYGAPSRALREQGFWQWPVRILNVAGDEVGRVTASGEARGAVKVLRRHELSGHGGGYISLMLAIPEGCRADHGPEPEEY